MDRKRNCHSKKSNDPVNPSESDKSVTGIYYGKFSNLIGKKKIKCIYEPPKDFNESTGSLAGSQSNLGKSKSPIEVKIFNKEDASTNPSFFDQGDLSAGCIKPSGGSGNSESLGIAIGLQIPAQQGSKDLAVVVEFDVVGKSSTSLTDLKQYTSRMKLSEETPSKMIFNGVVKLQPRDEPFQITSIPLYIIDPKEKIVANSGFTVSYKTSSKPGDNLVVDKPMEVLVKLKVDKPPGLEGENRNKECCCNKPRKSTVSDSLMGRKSKNKVSIDESKSGPRSGSTASNKSDKNTEAIETADRGTQSNVNIQASKSNQTASQVSVSSGKDLRSKSNQTNETKSASKLTDTKSTGSIKSPQKSMNTQSVNTLQIVENKKFKFDVETPSANKKSEVNLLPIKKESKHEQKRREGWERLEKKRSKEDAKLTSQNPNSALRNAATQSSFNKTMENKEISAQYSFIPPTFAILADHDSASSSSTLTDSLVPVKSAQFAQNYPSSVDSTSTQWPLSLTSNDDRSQTLTLISDVLDSGNLVVPTNTPENQSPPASCDRGAGSSSSSKSQQVMAVTFSTQTDLFGKPEMINTYSQYLCYPVEDEIMSVNLSSENKLTRDITRSQDTLDLLERAKIKLGEYAENRYFSFITNPFSSEELVNVCSISKTEECAEDDGVTKYIDKEVDAVQRAKRQSLFTRFINCLKPAELPVTIAQYHTFCATANPFQLKAIRSIHDLREVGKSSLESTEKFELELQTMEIEKVNSKLDEEIHSLQKMYDDLSSNMSFIFENQDIFPILPIMQSGDNEKRSIKTIKSDISRTFIELRGCLSTMDQILITASAKSVYETPSSSSFTSAVEVATENDAQPEDILSHEIQSTYTTVENDIKKTIKELLKESEYIKHEALLNGAQEEPEPPFFFEYFDLLNQANPLLICKSIVDDLTNKSSNGQQEPPKEEKKCTIGEKSKKCRQEDSVKEKLNGGKKSFGSCSRIKTDVDGSTKKETKQKVDNKKNDRITYFCTTFVSKIPKTSFSFGGNSRSLHRETKRIQKKENVTDNTTSGDNAKIHDDDEEFCKTCSNIMEPNLNPKNLFSVNEKNVLAQFESKNEVGNQNYEQNLSYANYIAYLNATNSSDDFDEGAKNIAEIRKNTDKSNLLEGVINNEMNILQLQDNVLANDSYNTGSESSRENNQEDDDVPKSKDDKEEVPSQSGTVLKPSKSFLFGESFINRLNDLPSTSSRFYRGTETTDEEEVIREIDLTVENHETADFSLEEPLILREDRPSMVSPHPQQQQMRWNRGCTSTTSSDEHIVRKNPPKHVRKSKDFKLITIKPKNDTIMDSDSDETVLKMMQKNANTKEPELLGGSTVWLRSTRANTNISMQRSIKRMLGLSCSRAHQDDSSPISSGNEDRRNPTETDYEADSDTEQMPVKSPKIFKSQPELNSPEEIAQIEANVRQNDLLERENLRIFLESVSSETIYDDNLSTINNLLVTDYNPSDSSQEICSSANNT